MSRIKSKDTAPEMRVRSALHRAGYRFRLHAKDLPGKPDIVLPKYKTVIFVHGCFWHRHNGCSRATMPSSNQEYWKRKFKRNVERDKLEQTELKKLDWKVIVVWECEIAQKKWLPALSKRLRSNLNIKKPDVWTRINKSKNSNELDYFAGEVKCRYSYSEGKKLKRKFHDSYKKRI